MTESNDRAQILLGGKIHMLQINLRSFPARNRAITLLVLAAAGLVLGAGVLLPGSSAAQDICSKEGQSLMRRAGIAASRITGACALAKRDNALLAISLKRREEALGYCLITLSLHNNTTQYLNHLSITSRKARFEIFRFHNIQPGATGYASAKSRILLACDRLEEAGGIEFLWPSSLRMGDRYPRGDRLERLKPRLLDAAIHWSK